MEISECPECKSLLVILYRVIDSRPVYEEYGRWCNECKKMYQVVIESRLEEM